MILTTTARRRTAHRPLAVVALVGTIAATTLITTASATPPRGSGSPTTSDATHGVRPPRAIPDRGALPPMVDPALADAVALKARAARFGPAPGKLRALARRHFGQQRVPEVRRTGLDLLRTYSDAGALFAMPFSLSREAEDVRAAVVAHLADSGDDGQAALAWTAIHHDDEDWRRAAADAITRPATPRVLAVLQLGLEDSSHETVVRAGRLAGTLDARLAIPHLIATQYSADTVRNQGDLGWIAMGTQRSYVRNLIPVTGDGAGGFQPVPGIINEGFVMRVQDAVAIVYRTEVHRVLVDMTSRATDTDTSANGWSLAAWRDWYNREYLPRVQDEAGRAARAAASEDFADAERRRRAIEASDRQD